jgi:hypothetical protein
MQRYLVIDAACSLCAELARSTCNETKNWIDGVVSLRAQKTRDLLSAGGRADLWQPALIEVENKETRVYAGFGLRWRLLLNLGPRRTWRLVHTLVGGILKAPRMEEKGREVAHGESRRRFVSVLAKTATAMSVLTGLGFSNKALAHGGSSSTSVDSPFAGWLAQLRFGKATKLTPGELQGLWTEFRSSASMRKLLESTHLHGYPDIPCVQQAVSEITPPANVQAMRHAVDNGRTLLDVIGVQQGSLTLVYYSLKAPGALEPIKTRLLLLTLVNSTESRARVRVLGRIEDGTPTFFVPASANLEECDLGACQQEHGMCFQCQCTDYDWDWLCIATWCSSCAYVCIPDPANPWCLFCFFVSCPLYIAQCGNVCLAEGCAYSAGLCGQ